jgi:hypothetical protein
MTVIFIFAAIIFAGFIINYYKTKKEKDSPFNKIRKKLEEDLMQYKFSGDWEQCQRINLKLLWLKTIKEVESRDSLGNRQEVSDDQLLSKLTFEDIKFPLRWSLSDFYCYPFAQEIISAYGIILANNDYNGMFKPESILPVPKEFIRKAILYTFDYFNLKSPIYQVPDKANRAKNLNQVNAILYISFINTKNEDLPKSGIENYNVGNSFKQKQSEYNEVNDLKLIDWRSDLEWIAKGVHYTDAKQFDYAIASFDMAKIINPNSKDLQIISAITYFTMGLEHFKKGERELAFVYINKSAELQNEDAIKWLKEN